MKNFLFVAVLVLILAPIAARAQDIKVNYEPGVDFTKFKTYSWVAGRAASNPQIHKLVVAEIDRQLQGKGLQRLEANGDFSVVYYTSLDENINTSAVAYMKSSDWRKWGEHEPVYGPKMVAMPIARLVLDIVDASANRLIWRGRAKDPYTPNQARGKRRASRAVAKLLARFPPASSK